MKPRRAPASRKPLVQAVTRLRRAFPEVWVRYQLLADSRGYDEPTLPLKVAKTARRVAEPPPPRKPPRRAPRST